MQGTAGNVITATAFLTRGERYGHVTWSALIIADEMITGFGRTGKMWGVEHSGVIPDIITLGKQFGGGFPMPAGSYQPTEITQAKPWANPSGSSSSYGGNPLAGSGGASVVALNIIEEEGLVENARNVGGYFFR